MPRTVRTLLRLSAAILLLAFPGCGRRATIRPLAADAVVVAFGDSLTRGTGADAGEDYPAVLARLSGWNVINAGIPGERSDAGLARLPSVIDEYRPDLVILCHGGNDILAGADDAAIAANLRQMIEAARAGGADVVLLGVPKRGLLLESAAFYGELAAGLGVPCDDEILPRILSRNALKSDYVHPNAAGYALLAEAVWKLAREAQR